MKKYTVEYMEHDGGDVLSIETTAQNKPAAYDKVVYEILDNIPYAAWVASTTSKSGKTKRFNTFAGNPY